MRAGVYIDGYNLYYGGKFLCGPGTPGWRWLDLRALATRLVTTHSAWTGATIDRIVYCTARISGVGNPIGSRQLTPADFYACQLRDPVGRVPKPTPW
jgi:hypothetical protein